MLTHQGRILRQGKNWCCNGEIELDLTVLGHLGGQKLLQLSLYLLDWHATRVDLLDASAHILIAALRALIKSDGILKDNNGDLIAAIVLRSWVLQLVTGLPLLISSPAVLHPLLHILALMADRDEMLHFCD